MERPNFDLTKPYLDIERKLVGVTGCSLLSFIVLWLSKPL